MAEDIFGLTAKAGDNFKDAEKAVLIASSALYLVQQWQVQYQLQLQPVYECGTSTVYFSAKHGSGTLTVNQIIGTGAGDPTEAFGKICSPEDVSIEGISGQCNSGTEVSFTLVKSILTGYGLSGTAQNSYVTRDLTASFVSMTK